MVAPNQSETTAPDETAVPDEEGGMFNSGKSAEAIESAVASIRETLNKMPTFSNPLGESFPLFSRPVQRQRWGDTQIHPVVNWGDLFFDLFYVGAAYNLSYIIVNDPTTEGFLYFLGAFFPMMQIWLDKTFYDSRFYFRDDLYHRIFEVLLLCAVATVVVHIRPVDILSRPSEFVDMFALCLGLLIAKLFSIWRMVEIIICVKGGPEAASAAKRDIASNSLAFCLYLAATIVSGIEYFGNESNRNKTDASYPESYPEEDEHRFLAGEEVKASGETTNVPIWIILSAPFAWMLYYSVWVLFFVPSNGEHKRISVPMNISFVIHRYGEWVMLMLGESILSLVIVDVLTPSAEYYLTFYAGILSVILLQYLYFRTQPHHPDDHAMRLSKERGIVFMALLCIYSAALVLVGTAYKMLVNEHSYESLKEAGRMLSNIDVVRMLAGAEPSGISKDDRQQRVANLFCWSMAAAWLCLDLMIIIHKGLTVNMGRCVCRETHKTRLLAVLLIVGRIGLIAFIATLSLYVTDPTALSLIGLGTIVAQIGLRVIGTIVFPSDRVHAEVDTQGLEVPQPTDEERKWPNTTRASVRVPESEEK